MTILIDPKDALRQYFGYDDFREGQRAIIDNTLAGRDAFVAMRTGGGKSLCYQIPALCLPGTALVISPLIALMKDQVDALLARGIPAAALNSNMSMEEVRDTLAEARAGKYKLLYIAPERFDSESFLRSLNHIDVSFTAVDESHCISVWGHDFRLAYRRLPDALDAMDRAAGRRLPRIALTATATPAVREDVTTQLRLHQPTEFMLGYDRDNLTLLVKNLERGEDKDQVLLDYLATRPKGDPTVIYSATIKAMPGIARVVQSTGRSVVIYNGQLPPEDRKRNQERFLAGEVDVIVATNAFGMGIDKSDIREVIHYHMPASLENYYQEVGRGGRDGKPARGMLLCQRAADERLQRFFIDGNHPHPASVRALYQRYQAQGKRKINVHRQSVVRGIPLATQFQDEALLRRLKHAGMLDYQAGSDHTQWEIEIKNPDAPLDVSDLASQRRTAEANLEAMIHFTATRECRRRALLLHFGEKNPAKSCGQCDRCLEPSHRRESHGRTQVSDGVSTAAVQVLLRLINDAGGSLTLDEASKTLLGVRDSRLIDKGLTRLDGFGRLKHYTQGKLWGVFAHVSRHMLVGSNGDRISLTPRGREALKSGNPASTSTLGGAVTSLIKEDQRQGEARRIDLNLRKVLTNERRLLAMRAGVNPLMVASESALDAMARLRPASHAGLIETGLNAAQRDRFGDAFLRCVKVHSQDAFERHP